MKEAGLTVVRIAEFTWSKIQPNAGQWEWQWLDDAMDAIKEAGLKVILCTPTACPPPWMVAADESILPYTDWYGQMQLGHRRHYSPHHQNYRIACREMAEEMAKRYAPAEHLIGFQVDNEIVGALNDHGPLAKEAFQAWLAKRHGDLQTLDERLGLIFWSQQYSDWSQIPLPNPKKGNHHPSLAIEFARFSSEVWVDFCRNQSEVMRPHLRDGQVLTTNCYLFKWGMQMDWSQLMRDGGLDCFAYDNYILSPEEGAFYNDIARSLSDPYWILEQQCGATGGQHLWPDREGRIMADTRQAVAKGAEVITFFRWRQALFGHEQDHGAIIDHHGRPGVIYDEVSAMTASLHDDPPAKAKPRIGVAFSWEDTWMTKWCGESIDYLGLQLDHIATAAHKLGEDVRYVYQPENLDELDVVVLPLKVQYDPAWEAAITAYVEQGGQVIAMPMLFCRDTYNKYRIDNMGAAMEALFGVQLERRIPVRDGHFSAGLIGTNAVRPFLRLEALNITDAEVVARYTAAPLKGEALLSKRQQGKGCAWYCSAYLPDGEFAAVLQTVLG